MIIFSLSKPVIAHMFRTYLIVPFLLIALIEPAHASGTLTDSLLILASKAEGHERISFLNQLAHIQIDFQPASSMKYAQMAHELSRNGENLRDQAESLRNIGAAWVSLGDMGKAAPFLDEAYGIYSKKLEEEETWEDHYHIAYILMLKGQFENSIDDYQRALGMADGFGPSGKALCLSGMGETYRKMGQFMQSIDFYHNIYYKKG